MTRERYADLARQLFLRSRREAPPCLPSDRRRLVGAVEQALRARARRRARVRWLASGGVVAAAAAAALVFVPGLRFGNGATRIGARGSDAPALVAAPPAAAVDPRALTVLSAADDGGPTHTAVDVSGGAARPIVHGMQLQAGIELSAPESGDVRIGTAEGTSLTIERGGELGVSEVGSTMRFALSRGAVRAHVAKLRAGERFIVETEDAEIEVHGTTFRVSLVEAAASCGAGDRTRVAVDEGVVTVSERKSSEVARIGAGSEWPEGCAAAARPTSPHAVARPPGQRGQPAMERRGRSSRPAAAARGAVVEQGAAAREPGAIPPSELAAQNDLFSAAMRATRREDDGEALKLFTSFVKHYPDSPLFEHALAQRMKLLVANDPSGAAAAASEYLSRFPTGFARLEARALAVRARP